MSLQVEKLEKNMAKLTIEVSADEFSKALEDAYQKNKSKISVPGFRKGKVPKKMIEQMYGKGVFYEDAANALIPEAYEKALEECEETIVSSPKINVTQIEEGKSFIFTAEVALKPEVTLGQYKGVEVDKVEVSVTDEEVEADLKQQQENNSRTVVVERPVQDGDIAVIDYEGFIDGVAFEGGKGTDYELTLGSGTFIPGFEEQIAGKKIGEEFDVNVKFPEEYHSEELKGKDAVFKVTLKGIKVKELPTLDDEFAKDVSEFDTLDALKEDIKAKLTKEAENKTKAEIENRALEAAVEGAEIDLPECMVDNQVEKMLEDYAYRLKSQGIDMKMYLQYTQMTEDQLKEQMKPSAKQQVLGSLVLEKIAELEKPDVPTDLPFTDLTQDWYMDSIRYVYEHELMYGTTDTTFAPDDALTRGMFVTMLYRMEGKPEATGNTSFTDVPAGAYYADAVAWASANGVVYGTSETAFSPEGKITREQMAAMMRRYASFKKLDTSAKADLSTFTDASAVSAWATGDMQWAVASELLYGNNHNQLQPTANATRAQAAAILQRFATKIVK